MLCIGSITNEGLSFVIADGTLPAMDVSEQRLENVKLILATRFGGTIAKLAAAIGRDANQTRFILNPNKPGGRNIGEKLARTIEARLGLDPFTLDNPPTTSQSPTFSEGQLQVKEAIAKYLVDIPDDVAKSLATIIKNSAGK